MDPGKNTGAAANAEAALIISLLFIVDKLTDAREYLKPPEDRIFLGIAKD
jgi:hypothetical protein